jgi:hypothetical protein
MITLLRRANKLSADKLGKKSILKVVRGNPNISCAFWQERTGINNSCAAARRQETAGRQRQNLKSDH